MHGSGWRISSKDGQPRLPRSLNAKMCDPVLSVASCRSPGLPRRSPRQSWKGAFPKLSRPGTCANSPNCRRTGQISARFSASLRSEQRHPGQDITQNPPQETCNRLSANCPVTETIPALSTASMPCRALKYKHIILHENIRFFSGVRMVGDPGIEPGVSRLEGVTVPCHTLRPVAHRTPGMPGVRGSLHPPKNGVNRKFPWQSAAQGANPVPSATRGIGDGEETEMGGRKGTGAQGRGL